MDSDDQNNSTTPNQPDIEAVPPPETSQINLPEPPSFPAGEDPTDTPPPPAQ